MLKSTITCVLHPSRQVSICCMVHVFVETFNTSFSKRTQEHLSNWNHVKYHIHANHEAVHCVALWTRVTLGLDMCRVCTEAVHCVALWTRVTLGLDMCTVCTEAVHCVALWTRVTLGLDMCTVYTEAVHCVALWTRVTLGLDMCTVCTEAVHCVALWTRVTLGLDMCRVCTKAVHCVALWTRVILNYHNLATTKVLTCAILNFFRQSNHQRWFWHTQRWHTTNPFSRNAQDVYTRRLNNTKMAHTHRAYTAYIKTPKCGIWKGCLFWFNSPFQKCSFWTIFDELWLIT